MKNILESELQTYFICFIRILVTLEVIVKKKISKIVKYLTLFKANKITGAKITKNTFNTTFYSARELGAKAGCEIKSILLH